MLRVRTVLSGTAGGPYLSTMYFQETATLTNAQNCNTAVGNFWGAVDNQLPNILNWSTQGTVEEISNLGVLTNSFGVTPVTGVGSLTGSLAPSVLQAVLQCRTGSYINGRENRGRIFIPGLLTSNDSSGNPSTTFKNAINTAAAALIADANTTWCIWSRKNGVNSAIISAVTWSTWGVLRSRRT